nr:EOG090X05Q1 [Moina brachiata]
MMMPGKRLLFQLCSVNNTLQKRVLRKCFLRTFLSDAYKCESEWKGRLDTPLLTKFKNENLYGELLKKFQNDGKASAIDVDLFSNLVLNDLHLEDLEDITRKFRRCPNTVHSLPSTGHAVIRTFLEHKNTETLMRMLDDRLNYGLFLDSYLSNLLMDSFLKEENYRDAAKVAIQLMLQEEFDHPITTPLALYSCYTYLKKPMPEPWDPQPKPKPEEPVEEVKVRVDYIREPYFDDHFDLTNSSHLVGKTLASFGRHLARSSPEVVAYTSMVLGWTLFEKYDNVIKCLDDVLSSQTKPLQEVLDIKEQQEAYKKWEVLRQEELQNQIDASDRRRRIAVLEAKKKELQEKEMRLNFFDNLDDALFRDSNNLIKTIFAVVSKSVVIQKRIQYEWASSRTNILIERVLIITYRKHGQEFEGVKQDDEQERKQFTDQNNITKWSLQKGKRKAVKAVVKRFYRLAWGAWIRPMVGRDKRHWRKTAKRKIRDEESTMLMIFTSLIIQEKNSLNQL